MSGFQELLVLDQQGFITEATVANVFFLSKGKWHTPALNRSGVAGVMRQHILNRFPDIRQVNWRTAVLPQIDAIAVTNALMGIVAVKQFGNRILQDEPVLSLRQQVLC